MQIYNNFVLLYETFPVQRYPKFATVGQSNNGIKNKKYHLFQCKRYQSRKKSDKYEMLDLTSKCSEIHPLFFAIKKQTVVSHLDLFTIDEDSLHREIDSNSTAVSLYEIARLELLYDAGFASTTITDQNDLEEIIKTLVVVGYQIIGITRRHRRLSPVIELSQIVIAH